MLGLNTCRQYSGLKNLQDVNKCREQKRSISLMEDRLCVCVRVCVRVCAALSLSQRVLSCETCSLMDHMT